MQGELPPADDREARVLRRAAAWSAHQEAMQTRLERMASLERQISALQASQVEEAAAFVQERVAFDEEHGFLAGPAQHRGVVAEVALAKGVSVITAERFLSDAYLLTTRHPHTLNALRRGTIGLTAARVIAGEACVLSDADHVRLADEILSEEAADVLPGKVRALAERRVAEIDPAAALSRCEQARDDRHVRLLDTGAGTASLEASLPAEQAAACWAALRAHADSARAAGDGRLAGHLMCEALVERITGLAPGTPVPATVNVVMTDTTLLGVSDAPAHLVGCSVLPAPVARSLATSDAAWLKRFLTDPVDGSITSGDGRGRRFARGALRDFVKVRDQHCRGIACASPIRDVDHLVEYRHGGATTASNSQGLSRNCHRARDDARMQVSRDERTGVVTWLTPSGLVHRSLPPPSLAPGSLNRSQRTLRSALLHPSESRLEQRLVDRLVDEARGPSG